MVRLYSLTRMILRERGIREIKDYICKKFSKVTMTWYGGDMSAFGEFVTIVICFFFFFLDGRHYCMFPDRSNN